VAGESDDFDFKRSFKLRSRGLGKIDWNKPKLPDYVPGRPQPSMGDASSRSYAGLVSIAGHLVTDILDTFGGLDFNDSATPWERKWSALCKDGSRFTPVMFETPLLGRAGLATVAGHYGTVKGTELITPLPATGSDGMLFVFDILAKGKIGIPDGWVEANKPESVLDVLTTVDGQVLTILRERSTGGLEAEFVTPLDLFNAVKVLVELAALGAKLVTVMVGKGEDKLVRSVLGGPTSELAKQLSKQEGEELAGVVAKKATGFETLKELLGLHGDLSALSRNTLDRIRLAINALLAGAVPAECTGSVLDNYKTALRRTNNSLNVASNRNTASIWADFIKAALALVQCLKK
jgi:hypothetical protein